MEQLVQAHIASPTLPLQDLMKGVHADPKIIDAALNHSFAKGRLPRSIRPRSKQELLAEGGERLLAHLAAERSFAADPDKLATLLTIEPQDCSLIIKSLAERNCIIVTADRVLRPPNDSELRKAFKELPIDRVSECEIAGTSAVADYAHHCGITTGEAALIFARALQQQLKLIRIGNGEYRTKMNISAAVRRIRALFQEYKGYTIDELAAAASIDDPTFRYLLSELKSKGSLRKNGDLLSPSGAFSVNGWPCCECHKRTRRVDAFQNMPLCAECRSRFPEKYGCVTKTRALREFRLKEHELYRLVYIERDNPYYKSSAPMHLFLLSQVRELAKVKWGGSEPYLISLTEFSEDQLRFLQEDPERLKQLTPERFQLLLADRFEAMGLCVQLVGRANERDGGIDLIAFPDPRSNQPKYLLAVQAEHHRVDRKTGTPKVQKFVGAMQAVPQFRLGFVVTNTSFTWTAQQYAKNQSHFLRLRSLNDLIRWLRDDFENEAGWQEIPDFVSFGGFRVPILKPKFPKLVE